MGRRKLTAEKKNEIASLIEAYDIKTTGDLQDALKDLLGGTIQEMLEAEFDEQMGYEKYEVHGTGGATADGISFDKDGNLIYKPMPE